MDKNQQKVLDLLEAFVKICNNKDIWYSLAFGSVLGAVRHEGFIPWDSDIDVFVRGDQLEELIDILNTELPENMCLYVFGDKSHYSLSNMRICYKNGKSQSAPYLDLFILMGMPDSKDEQTIKIKRCRINGKFFSCKYKNISHSKTKNIFPILCLKPIAFLFSDKEIGKKYFYEINEYIFDHSKYVCTLSCYYGMKECFPSEIILNRKLHKFENREFYIPENYHLYLTQLYGDYMTPKRY